MAAVKKDREQLKGKDICTRKPKRFESRLHSYIIGQGLK